jgi:uncharacterized protein YndB with AHSA1/START domain
LGEYSHIDLDHRVRKKEPQMNDRVSANKPGTSPEQATVRIKRMLPGPIERVWAYLTESGRRATWFAGGVFDLRAGGKAEFHFDHSLLSAEPTPPEMKQKRSDWTETITRIEPPRLLSYTFQHGGPESEVTFELQTVGKGVLLVLTHRRIVDRKTKIGLASGWDAHLLILEDRLNAVEPRPFWATHAQLRKEYEARL